MAMSVSFIKKIKLIGNRIIVWEEVKRPSIFK
jgi:hypothetical protein